MTLRSLLLALIGITKQPDGLYWDERLQTFVGEATESIHQRDGFHWNERINDFVGEATERDERE